MSTPKNGETIAVVECLIGDRRMSTVMRNAGLGIEKVGTKHILRMKYDAGEFVDELRVMSAVNYMIEQLNADDSEMEISNPKVISIQTVNYHAES